MQKFRENYRIWRMYLRQNRPHLRGYIPFWWHLASQTNHQNDIHASNAIDGACSSFCGQRHFCSQNALITPVLQKEILWEIHRDFSIFCLNTPVLVFLNRTRRRKAIANSNPQLSLKNFHPPCGFFFNFVEFLHNRYFWIFLCRFAGWQYFFQKNVANVLKFFWHHFEPFRPQTQQYHVVIPKKITGIWGHFTKYRNILVLRF